MTKHSRYMDNRNHRVYWSSLPLELLRSIAQLLKVDTDLCHFRAVCKKWRHSASITALLPYQINCSPPGNLYVSFVLLLRPHGSEYCCYPWMVRAVGKSRGRIHLYNPFSGELITGLPPNLHLAQFQSSRLAVAYHIACSGTGDIEKVFLFSDQSVPCMSNCSLLVLYSSGCLREYAAPEACCNSSYLYCFDSPLEVPKGTVFDQINDLVSLKGAMYALDQQGKVYQMAILENFDDFVSVEGNIYVVDWQGKLYQMVEKRAGVLKLLIGTAILEADTIMRWKKRLAKSSATQKLYLIVREMEMFRVYELHNSSESCTWVQVHNFDDNQVLFVSGENCFFVAAREFPGCRLSNCIIFSPDAFPSCNERFWASHLESKAKTEIKIFQLGGHCNTSKSISDYPGLPVMLCSIPLWISLAKNSIFKSFSQRLPEDEDARAKSQEDASEVPSSATAAQREVPDTSTERTERPIPQAYTSSMFRCNQSDTSTAKFKGFDIRTSMIPTLEKIWLKHGNLVECSIMHNSDMISRSLECVAKSVLILEGNSAKSLSDSDASYLSTAIMDLQQMCVKVDWLVPYVKKAVRLHKSKELSDSLEKLAQQKVQVIERRSELFGEIAKLDRLKKELEEVMNLSSTMMISSPEEEILQPLAKGLT